MKKGDIKKLDILNTAEMLFCRKGYEQTSIQDILDQLHTSKGSFYHHYVSKESVLEGICKRRAEQIYQTLAEKQDIRNGTLNNLNLLLSGMIPFQNEKLSFLLMLLPIFNTTDGRTVRAYFCDALSDCFRKSVCILIAKGADEGSMLCPEPGYTTDIILSAVNGLWTGICDFVLKSERDGAEADVSEILRMTDCYRLMIERMLSLPYGVIELTDLQAVTIMCRQIHSHWLQ